ncbi:MAG: hypothetical protein PHC62_00795 [Candidatus Izemoplasmatales bacterium]|nr:hypothetical protein [Candidatus Izemoplasmatales bacterium]
MKMMLKIDIFTSYIMDERGSKLGFDPTPNHFPIYMHSFKCGAHREVYWYEELGNTKRSGRTLYFPKEDKSFRIKGDHFHIDLDKKGRVKRIIDNHFDFLENHPGKISSVIIDTRFIYVFGIPFAFSRIIDEIIDEVNYDDPNELDSDIIINVKR